MSDVLNLVRTNGRAEAPLTHSLLREMTAADVELSHLELGVKAPNLVKRLTDRHHALARNLAAGMKVGEAAAICGYDISRVSILQGDPTFQELLVFYRENVDAKYAQLHETLAGLSVDAAIELRERLENAPEDLTPGQLIEITKMAADRTGHGPSTTANVNINVGIAKRMEEARRRVAARRHSDVLDLEVIPNGDPVL